MTTQTSRLEIIVDTSKGKKGTDDLTKSLEQVEKQGDKAEKSTKETAKAISDTGEKSKGAAPKIKGAADAIKKVGDEANQSADKVSSFRSELSKAANDGKFGSGIQGMTGKLAEFRAGGLLAAAAIGGAVVGGVALAAGALTKIAFDTAQANVELLQFATIAGTTTQAFQGLAGAAATFGISQEKLSDQLKDFNEKIGEFNAIGAGGAVDFFEQIAVKTEGGAEGAKKLAEEMSKMDGIEALQTYVDKLEEAGVNQKEMSFYLESMGSDLTALAPLLEDGGKLWKDYQKAMEDAGVTTSEDAIQKSIELAAQQESLQMRFGALKSELANQVMPVLSKIINLFMDGSDQGGQFSGVIKGIGFAAKGVGVLIVGLATGMKNLVEIMSLVVNQFKTIGTTAVNFANADGIQAKGSALLSGAKDFVWGNGAKAVSNIYSNSKQGFSAMGGILSSQAGQYDALTQAIINNKNAQLKYNREQGRGVGGGAEQNKNLFPTAKAPKSSKAETNKAANEAKRAAEQQKREAERLQAEIERAKERVIREYADKEQRLFADYQDSKKEIQKAFADDPTNLNLYLKKAKDTYEKEVAAYRSAQKDKLDSFKRDFSDRIADASETLGLLRAEKTFGRDSRQYAGAQLDYNENRDRSEAKGRYSDDVKKIEGEFDPVTQAKERHELLQQAELAHNTEMQAIDQAYHQARSELQTQWAQSYVTGTADVLKQVLGENSKAYQAMFAMQKAMAIAQVMMNAPTTFSNVYTSVSQIPYVGWVMAPVAAGAAVALQLAQAATIGSVSYNPAGMAHDGIDNIPKEGTWLLDKGERVLSPRQNKDFTDFMSGQKQAPSAPSEQYNITIQALDGKSVERMLKKNNRHVAGSMKGYARNFGR